MVNAILNNLFEFGEVVTQAVEHVGDDLCSEPGLLKGIRFLGYLLYIAKIFVPVIVIVWGTFDLYKSVIAGDADSLKKQTKVLLFRIMLGAGIFLLPGIINWTLSQLGDYENEGCISCLLEPFDCSV